MGSEMVMCFFDLVKAYDQVFRDKLWETLESKGFGPTTIRLLKLLYEDEISLKIDGMLEGNFGSTRGVKQGCLLSPLLFNLVFDRVMSGAIPLFKGLKLQHETGEWVAHGAAYADDLGLVSGDMEDMQHNITVLAECAADVGLTISVKKTKYMWLRAKARAAVESDAGNRARCLKRVGRLGLADDVPLAGILGGNVGSAARLQIKQRPCGQRYVVFEAGKFCPREGCAYTGPTSKDMGNHFHVGHCRNHMSEVAVFQQEPTEDSRKGRVRAAPENVVRPTITMDGDRLGCSHCPQTFASNTTANRHVTATCPVFLALVSRTATPKESPLQCEICHKTMANPQSLGAHNRNSCPLRGMTPKDLERLCGTAVPPPAHDTTAHVTDHVDAADDVGPPCKPCGHKCKKPCGHGARCRYCEWQNARWAKAEERPAEIPQGPRVTELCGIAAAPPAHDATIAVTEHAGAAGAVRPPCKPCKHECKKPCKHGPRCRYCEWQTAKWSKAEERPAETHQGPRLTKLSCYGKELEEVTDFLYLGYVLDIDGRDTKAIELRMKGADATFHEMAKPCLLNPKVPLKIRLKGFDTIVQAKLLYAGEAWTLRDRECRLLDAWFHRKLRWVTGQWPRVEGGRITMISNRELRDIARKPLPLSEYVKVRQLRWAGHVLRMPPTHLTRKAVETTTPGSALSGCAAGTHSVLGYWEKLASRRGASLDACKDRVAWRNLLTVGARPNDPHEDSTKSAGETPRIVLRRPRVFVT